MQALEYFPSLTAMFFTRAMERGERPFLWAKQGEQWQPISWMETARRVASMAKALKALGVAPGDRVMLVCENRPEFCIADLAIMAAGAITVPTYTTNTTRDHEHIIGNSGARAVIFSTAKIGSALLPAVVRSRIEFAISIEPIKSMQNSAVQICDWATLIAEHPADPVACAAEQTATRDDIACLIYTSGTGGAPRGVIQHHGAILCNVEGCVDIIAGDFGWDDEVFLSFLPISHAYEHSGGQFLPIGLGGQIYYAESLEKLASNIAETRPTIMVVVPRLFELLKTRVTKAVEKQGKFPSMLLEQTLRLGAKRAERGGTLALWDKPLEAVLNRTINPKIQARFGGRMKALVSGGAPLNPEVGTFFQSFGLTLLQGYGQTESGPVVSCNRPSVGLRMDTVGPPLKHVEVRIAEDGEILVRGELVMKGYWNNPAETARAIQDGWLHTGDIGRFDDVGRLMITDRKKDLIVNDKGDNVAPAKLEGMLTLQPEIGQVMVHGDRRPHIVALIVPDPDWLKAWAQTQGKPADLEALREDPALHGAIRAAVDRVNIDLSVIEKVRRFALADEPFTIDNEMLTPKQSIRRHVIRARYQARLDALYKA
ncbi:long-chain acyl-CoA synthetase [Sphingobium sp. B1D7B]|uniref:AMP-dependent synthetase/ligase n=1 Tax=unclassified Sphingobium TaxID=2611147 RepID=UPI0022246424|nr:MULTISPECIES: AMP-dependent synthetase/ligase [unclassified Sphingobium]MCW2391608.1 long-chain acyl-CoA synthetase [Sphingobium sp. B11D3A]MCW2406823.1 long-chain acyl-CoA synthetase [Sphingobium sp. B1D7B]